MTIARTLFAICVAALSLTAAPASTANGVLVDMDVLYADIASAKSVTLSAFSLSPRGKMTRLLVEAAQRGASVSVALDGKAFGFSKSENRETISVLEAAKVRVHLTNVASHLKAVVIDGSRTYLSDRNFTNRGASEIVIRDPYDGDRELVERAMLGVPRSNAHLWLRKRDAIVAEARLIAESAGSDLHVETESFGAGTPVYAAMLASARSGKRVRLLVARSEFTRSRSDRNAVSALEDAGVDARTSTRNEKLAIAGTRSWVGSANLTRGLPDQIDFGFVFDDAATSDQIETQFEKNWSAGRAILMRK